MQDIPLDKRNTEKPNMSETISLESYPPMFKQQINQITQEHDPDGDHNRIQESEPIPLIDLQHLNPDNLAQACRDWGLFRLVNHGVPSTLLNQLHHLVTKIFNLSFESKQSLFDASPVSYFWGTPALTPSGSAHSTVPKNMDWVEGFNVPLCKLSQFERDEEEEDPMLCSLRVLMEEYGQHMARIGRALFEGMEMGLKLDPEQSKSKLSEPTGLVRVYRYPICGSPEEVCGIHKHTDSSVLSILAQFEVDGLEVFKDDKWILVRPTLDSLIVNLGDMMQAMSNDEYKSVIHRVKVSKNRERSSICYFVFPDEDCVIRSSNYKPFTYRDFQTQVQQDVKTLGSKVGLERFRLCGP